MHAIRPTRTAAVRTPAVLLLLTLALAACDGRTYSDAPRATSGTEQPRSPVPNAAPNAAPTTAPPLLNAPVGEAEYRRNGVDESQMRADVEDCYYYARGLVQHDRRIESDREATIQGGAGDSGTTMFRRQVQAYGEDSTYRRSFDACMRGKGYERR